LRDLITSFDLIGGPRGWPHGPAESRSIGTSFHAGKKDTAGGLMKLAAGTIDGAYFANYWPGSAQLRASIELSALPRVRGILSGLAHVGVWLVATPANCVRSSNASLVTSYLRDITAVARVGNGASAVGAGSSSLCFKPCRFIKKRIDTLLSVPFKGHAVIL